MSNLQRKLRSRMGASMILALLFLMFCSFVGGSVLVSATANAYRVTQWNEQQDFLNQRSAALLLADELRLAPNQYFRIKVIDETTHIQEMKWTDEGAQQAEPTSPDRCYDERTVTFRIETNGNITQAQRMMIELTAWRYLLTQAEKESAATKFTVVMRDFVKDGSGADVQLPAFHYSLVPTNTNRVTIDPSVGAAIECELTVTPRLNSDVSDLDALPQFKTYFSSGYGDNLYDFIVDFGEESFMKLAMESVYAPTLAMKDLTHDPEAGNVPGLTGCTGLIQVTETKNESTIHWQEPEIEKGGA